MSRLRYWFLLDLIAVLSCGLISGNAYAQTTGYARYMTPAQMTALANVHRAAMLSPIAAAAVTPAGAASIGIRLVAGPVGWASLGVAAGLVLAQVYYSQPQAAALKTAALASLPTTIRNGSGTYTAPQNVGFTNTFNNFCTGSYPCSQQLVIPNSRTFAVCTMIGQTPLTATPPGFTGSSSWASGGPCRDNFNQTFFGPSTDQLANLAPTSITEAEMVTFVGNMPAADPNSIENHVQAVGQGVSPTSATNTVTQPATTTEAVSQVAPIASVPPGSTIINNNAPVTNETNITNNTTTTTTTTVNNPNGSTTQTSQDTSTFSCGIGTHDLRTMGSILSSHIATWQTVGVVGSLAQLKNIVWPNTIPPLTVGPTMFGTFSLNLTPWTWAISDLRLIILALAAITGIVIVFRGRASS